MGRGGGGTAVRGSGVTLDRGPGLLCEFIRVCSNDGKVKVEVTHERPRAQ